jgi:hypothetical protein
MKQITIIVAVFTLVAMSAGLSSATSFRICTPR